MIYIKYNRPVYREHMYTAIKYEGPYLEKFETHSDAMNWVKSNDIEIVNIEFIDE